MTPSPIVASIPGPLYRHLIATTLLHSLVVVGALPVDAMAPWAAALVLAGALAQAAHAAHLRERDGRSSERAGRER